jgi:putative glycosyltransferase (TIGR04372 family)
MLYLSPPAMAFFLVMRLLRPWFLIRINPLFSSRIGHFAANTELYLCERDAGINVPKQRYVDLSYYDGRLANEQLAIMWGRHLNIWPAWLLGPVFKLNRFFPGGSIHEVGDNTQSDRDVHNLLERMPPQLSFTPEEESRGKAGLRAMGIPEGSEFICLIVRDSAYLRSIAPEGNPDHYNYHDYRDGEVQNYVLAAEALADLGYYVIRMGAVVKEPLNSPHPRVIDYATNGMRSDFMDIYLGAHCLFCIGIGTGFDRVPVIFRRPVAYVNFVPVGYLDTYLQNALFLCKKHWLLSEQRWLSFEEIFRDGVGFCLSSLDYATRGVQVVENTPEEIKSLVVEMVERLKGTWQGRPGDDELQRRFWELFPVSAQGALQRAPLHGMVRGRYGAQFLRDNPEFLA